MIHWSGVVIVFSIIVVSNAYFDCRRRGMSCPSGSCNSQYSACSCAFGKQGSDCGLTSDSISSECPSGQCLNNGKCILDDRGLGCYCEDTYTGNSCQRRRADVSCNGENMTVTITPFPGFGGLIYVADHASNASCNLMQSKLDSIVVFQREFNLVDGCGGFLKNDAPKEGDVTYLREIIIQYNPSIVSRLDQIVTVSCHHVDANTTDLGSEMPTVDVDERTNMTLDETDTTYKPVIFEIQERSGSKVTPPIYIGRQLRMSLSLRDKGVYETLKIENCFAVNGLEDFEEKKQILIESSCPTLDALDVIRGEIEQSDDLSAVFVNFEAFKFTDTSDVVFECNVRMCKRGDDRCQPISCDMIDGSIDHRRRKRQVVREDRTLVKRKITVLDPKEKQITTESSAYRRECLDKPEILTTFIVMGSLVVTLFIICFYLVARIFRNKSKVTSIDQNVQPLDMQRIRIPRVRALF